VKGLKNFKHKTVSENEAVRQIVGYKQITPTFDTGDDGIWFEIDLLEGDPMHSGVAMRNPRFKPFWLRVEGDEWQGLWERACLRRGTDLICYPMMASLPVDTLQDQAICKDRGGIPFQGTYDCTRF
jgi:hypothetical protein